MQTPGAMAVYGRLRGGLGWLATGAHHMIFGKLALGLVLGFAFETQVETVEATRFACSGTLTIATETEVREEPWAFFFAIDSDKNAVTINDTSMAIVSDASEPIIGFRDDPSADPPLDGFWGGFDTVTGKINIHVRTGAIFTGICKPEP